MFEKMFKLKENNTTVKTEVVAGLREPGVKAPGFLLQNSGRKRPYSILMSTIQNESTLFVVG